MASHRRCCLKRNLKDGEKILQTSRGTSINWQRYEEGQSGFDGEEKIDL